MSTSEIQQLETRVLMLEHFIRTQLAGAQPVLAQPAKKTKKAKTEGPTLNKDGTPRKKRTTSGYQVFSNTLRVEVRTELEKNGSVKVKPSEVVSELAQRWKALSTERQQLWKDEAAEADAALVPVPEPSEEGDTSDED